jgi:hypothetical protein
MTFAPVVPAVLLLVVAAAVVALRLLSMRQLAAGAGQRWSTVWRWSGLTLAVLLLLIAAARPGIQHGEQDAVTASHAGQNTSVFFVVDRSSESQMPAIRADIDALIDRYPQARFAVITFAARPSLEWPLSADAWSLKPVVTRLSSSAGTADEPVNAAAAANVLRYQLIAAGQQYPDSQNLVFYFGSGAPGSDAPQGEFDPVAGSVDGGAVFGYGPPLDDPALRRIAQQLGVPYVERDDGQSVTAAAPGASDAPEVTVGSTGTSRRTELYWVFTIAAAVLLLFEVFGSIRDFRRMRTAARDVTL